MHLLYVFLVLTNLIILVFKKRNIDFVVIYTICLILFNITTFFGVVSNVHNYEFCQPNDSLYIISCIPLLFTIPFLFNNSSIIKIKPKDRTSLSNSFLFILLIVFLYSLFDNIDALFNSINKQESLDNSNLSRILLSSICVIGAIISIIYKKTWYTYIFIVCIAFTFFTGTRGPVVIFGFCFFLFKLFPKKIVLVKHINIGFWAACGLVFVILGKKMYGYIMGLGLIDGVTAWFNNFEAKYFIQGSEFLSTTIILNSVIDNDFTIPFEDVMLSTLSILPIPMSFWGLSSGIFNERFQPVLFGDVEYGMAYNIWAEAYSWFGLIGIIIYSVLIPFFLYKLWEAYSKNSLKLIGALYLYIGVSVAFFIHRESLGTMLGTIRNIIYPFIIFLFIAKIADFLINRIKQTKYK